MFLARWLRITSCRFMSLCNALHAQCFHRSTSQCCILRASGRLDCIWPNWIFRPLHPLQQRSNNKWCSIFHVVILPAPRFTAKPRKWYWPKWATPFSISRLRTVPSFIPLSGKTIWAMVLLWQATSPVCFVCFGVGPRFSDRCVRLVRCPSCSSAGFDIETYSGRPLGQALGVFAKCCCTHFDTNMW